VCVYNERCFKFKCARKTATRKEIACANSARFCYLFAKLHRVTVTYSIGNISYRSKPSHAQPSLLSCVQYTHMHVRLGSNDFFVTLTVLATVRNVNANVRDRAKTCTVLLTSRFSSTDDTVSFDLSVRFSSFYRSREINDSIRSCGGFHNIHFVRLSSSKLP